MPAADIAWIHAPTIAEVAAAYPAAARAKGLAGDAVLDCALDAAGRPGVCKTISETPRDAGFATAARGLTRLFQAPAGGRARIVFHFAGDPLAATTVTRPEWTALPTPAQFQSAFPEAASKAGVLKARAVMSCTVAPDGGLADCKAAGEEPEGYGFGAATLPLAPFFRLRIWSSDGQPVIGGVVRAPIRYDLKQAPLPEPPKP